MKIRAMKFIASTGNGIFGFSFEFSENLTIVRGSNSSGKSTFFNCLLYGLGMEELIGGRCERALPYAVKDHFNYNGEKIRINSSEVLVELSNNAGKVITLRRAIKDQVRDQKLIEIYDNKIDEVHDNKPATPLYLHDAGSARNELGFYRFFENFLQLNLPTVPTTSGGEAKLYLQEVFSAFAVEQKRGWTDYIANIPYYGIRDPRSKVVEFLLDLAVFETNAIRNRLNAEASGIDAEWNRLAGLLRSAAGVLGLTVDGLPRKVSSDFTSHSVRLYAHAIEGEPSVSAYISLLRKEYQSLNSSGDRVPSTGGTSIKNIEIKRDELLSITSIYDQTLSELEMSRASLKDFEDLHREARSDLGKNKAAKKLRDLGARQSLSIAIDACPTCHQPVEDSLLSESLVGPQMGLDANIFYLESQCRMLDRQISGTRDVVVELERRMADLSSRMTSKHNELSSLRSDFSAGELQTKAQLRRQVRIEIEIAALEEFQISYEELIQGLQEQAARLKINQNSRRNLPPQQYTESDEAQIALFEKNFRANAGSFEYTSARIGDIEINRSSLTPFLAQLELREIRTDIKSDSSASDFVRLIWSYLIALYQVSRSGERRGNHIGLMMFDEPGQHSMAEDSQRALLSCLAAETELQSIVAASFDESESVFNNATDGIRHKLIHWEDKLIQPFNEGGIQ